MNTRRAGILAAVAIGLWAQATAFSQTDLVGDAVSRVSQVQYTAYQQSIQDMGLGLFDANYSQAYRDRNGWAGAGSLGNQEARGYLAATLGNLGLGVAIQGAYQNVVAEQTGLVTPGTIYIVSAHYDSTGGSSSSERPGGDDNASGTAGVLEAARILSLYEFASTVRFIGFNAEEDGLLGSKNYVSSVVKNVSDPAHQDVAGVVNLDMILRPGNDASPALPIDLDVITNSNSLCVGWANAFIGAAHQYAPGLVIDSNAANTSNDGGSDQKPFIDAGYAALLAIENSAQDIWSGSNAYYHSQNDAGNRLANDPNNPSHITYDFVFATDVVRATVATIAQQAGVIAGPASKWRGASGDWSDPAGWTAGLPGGGLGASVGNGGAVTVSQLGASCVTLMLGAGPTQSGSVTMVGGSLDSGEAFVGYLGAGAFTQLGGDHHVVQALSIGAESNSVGAYTLAGGNLFAGAIAVGGTTDQKGGVGTLAICGGNAVVDDMLLVWSGSSVSLGLGALVSSDANRPALDVFVDGLVNLGDANGDPVVYCFGDVTGGGDIVIGAGATLWIQSLDRNDIYIDAGGTLVFAWENPQLYAATARHNYDLAVPEPCSLVVIGLGGLLLARRRRRVSSRRG